MVGSALRERAVGLHERGMAAASRNRPREASRLLRRALRLLDDVVVAREEALAALRARVLTSLAAAEVMLGNTRAGFDLVDRAQAEAAAADLGIVLQQRGLLLLLVGRLDEALDVLNDAIVRLDPVTRPVSIARCLVNRAMLHELTGRVRAAKADVRECERVLRTEDQPVLLAKAEVNRGFYEALIGDVPAALRAFDAARPRLAEHAPDLLPVLGVDKARALMGGGLVAEAAAELDLALALLPRRPTHERAEAELTRAQAAIAQGQADVAKVWARRAEQRFLSRGNETWASVAVLTRLRAEFVRGRRTPVLAADAVRLADRLAGLGLPHDAEVADLLAARVHTALGQTTAAGARLAVRRTVRPTVENRLSRCLAVAELRAAEGRVDRACASVRRGLLLLRRHRGRFGSIDLQTGAAALGADLADLGLAMSLRSATAPVVFAWLERCKAQAFRMRPVRPPDDADTADVLAELRSSALKARAAELAGRRDHAAERRCAELERDMRRRGWTIEGGGEDDELVRFRDVAGELSRADATMVSFLVQRGRLHGVVLTGGKAAVVPAGELAAVTEAVLRLRSDLDALCGRRLPTALAGAVTASIEHQVAVLAEALVAPFDLGDRDLVVVPTGPLATVPWGLLPGLRGRPVTVAPSASVWLRGRRVEPLPDDAGPLIVAGPDLSHAAAEAEQVARLFPRSTVLTGSAASVSATLAAWCGRNTVHVAAHGHHEHENVLFSRLDLADGPLMAYDLHGVPTAPRHVVLSACDVGRTVVRVGDELLGFTAALLYSGTRNVVAGVARVPDDPVAAEVMTRYHALHNQGLPPPRALAEATRDQPRMPLVCFGSG
ncbi:CHAT domain-containing protein [Saccharothrix sp. NPDC042600]|uniref:CHAT domain-containing protein n=1 Tax=Saccharothrix TaxID=2071 RepID=UPI0033E24DC1|nr:CHAT domain-containing protein [Saccharothrix mutabilis subsp. capreolus]